MEWINVIKNEPKEKLKKVISATILRENCSVYEKETSLVKMEASQHALLDFGYIDTNQKVSHLIQLYKVGYLWAW